MNPEVGRQSGQADQVDHAQNQHQPAKGLHHPGGTAHSQWKDAKRRLHRWGRDGVQPR
jgi:hypothetical protein